MTPQQNPQRIIPLLDLDLAERHWEVASDEDIIAAVRNARRTETDGDEAIIQQCRNGYLSNPEADNARFFSFSNH